MGKVCTTISASLPRSMGLVRDIIVTGVVRIYIELGEGARVDDGGNVVGRLDVKEG